MILGSSHHRIHESSGVVFIIFFGSEWEIAGEGRARVFSSFILSFSESDRIDMVVLESFCLMGCDTLDSVFVTDEARCRESDIVLSYEREVVREIPKREANRAFSVGSY